MSNRKKKLINGRDKTKHVYTFALPTICEPSNKKPITESERAALRAIRELAHIEKEN